MSATPNSTLRSPLMLAFDTIAPSSKKARTAARLFVPVRRRRRFDDGSVALEQDASKRAGVTDEKGRGSAVDLRGTQIDRLVAMPDDDADVGERGVDDDVEPLAAAGVEQLCRRSVPGDL